MNYTDESNLTHIESVTNIEFGNIEQRDSRLSMQIEIYGYVYNKSRKHKTLTSSVKTIFQYMKYGSFEFKDKTINYVCKTYDDFVKLKNELEVEIGLEDV